MSVNGPNVWGPPLWRILHSLAERLGRQHNSILVSDERRAWINFLKSVGAAIPCNRCKKHYEDWSKKNKIEAFLSHPYGTLREEARKWLWALHTEINEESKVTNIPLSDVENLYGKRTTFDISKDEREFTAVLMRLVALIPTLKRSLSLFQFATVKLRLSIG
jgi:hypothetical protein